MNAEKAGAIKEVHALAASASLTKVIYPCRGLTPDQFARLAEAEATQIERQDARIALEIARDLMAHLWIRETKKPATIIARHITSLVDRAERAESKANTTPARNQERMDNAAQAALIVELRTQLKKQHSWCVARWYNYDGSTLTKGILQRTAADYEGMVAVNANELARLRADADIPLARRQFPDGSVPGNTVECAKGWFAVAQKLRAENERLQKTEGTVEQRLEIEDLKDALMIEQRKHDVDAGEDKVVMDPQGHESLPPQRPTV